MMAPVLNDKRSISPIVPILLKRLVAIIIDDTRLYAWSTFHA
ncbi:MAG: hypothetical protein ACM31E_04735 [Fibrobacterota bacterium]